jgi:hypothetical protein
MKALFRVLGPVFALCAIAACGSSNTSAGVPNMQPGSACLGRGVACSFDADCCSQWCANGICSRKQP